MYSDGYNVLLNVHISHNKIISAITNKQNIKTSFKALKKRSWMDC